MDRIDRRLLGELERDGRQSFGALADKVGLSKTPCWARVQKLEQAGAIRGYRADVSPAFLQLDVIAFCDVRVDIDASAAFEAAVREHPAIIECYTTAGEGDYLLQVMTTDLAALDLLLREQISRLPGVVRTSTKICLKSIKQSGSLTSAEAAAARLRP